MKIENRILIFGICLWIPLSFIVNINTGYFNFNSARCYQWATFISDWLYNIYIVIFVLMTAIANKNKKGEFAKCFFIMLIIAIIVNSCKYIFFSDGFSRPSGNIGGFPSGHSFTVFAIAFLFSVNFPKLLIFNMLTAFLVAWSRIYAGGKIHSFIFSKEFYEPIQDKIPAHYPYQVVWGSILGLLLTYILYIYWKDIFNFFRHKKNQQTK